MIVVSDTSPILCLAYIDKLNLLSILFKEVVIPLKVYDELLGSRLPDNTKDTITNLDWIIIQSPSDNVLVSRLLLNLDAAEADAIALAKEMKADFLLIDEDTGRKLAAREGLRIMGVLGVLIEAKKKRLIDSLAPIFDELKEKVGFYISDSLYNYIRKSRQVEC